MVGHILCLCSFPTQAKEYDLAKAYKLWPTGTLAATLQKETGKLTKRFH